MKDEKKWLDYFLTYFTSASEGFISEMHNQLTSQFESYFGRKIDWSDNFSLFFAPIPERYILKYHLDKSGKEIAVLSCELEFLRYSIPAKIAWYSKNGKGKIHPDSCKDSSDVVFKIVEFDLSNEMREFILSYSTPINEPLDYNFKFPVYCVNGKMFIHEGHFIINIDKKDLRAIQEVIGKSLSKWNNDDVSIEGVDVKKNRGYFHSFGFKEWEDGKAKFVFDSGSAQDGVFEYLLSELDKSDIIINSIEIR